MGTNITGIGNANAIGFKSRVTGGMYFPPELKDALVGVWSAYGKSNDSTDRNIIKNKIKDRGGDFELINFNYEGTSGYNGYPVIFGKDRTYQYINYSPNYNQTTINVTHFNTRQALLYSYVQQNGELTSYNRDYPSYKIKVSGLEESFGLMYQYNSKANATSVSALRIEANGIYTIPKSFASDGSLTNANIWVGFVFTGTEQEQCNVTIEVLPEYKGAVVTDGVDDMIVSQNTVEEMGITDKFTVVSMIHQITLRGATAAALTNYIRQPIGHEYVRNHVANIGKTGIYGYAVYDVNHSNADNSHIINTILGDKNDYSIHIIGNLSQGKFSVQGYINGDNNAVELSQAAWYWTFIANGVLTEDEINLIIEKYNLDRPGEIVKPDVYYDIKRQKITNENHSSFDDELTDFSGNGHNMKLYNIAWEGNSGIGNYPVVFGANKTWKNLRAEDNNLSYKLIANSITVYKVLPNSGAIMWTYIKENEIIREIEIPSFTVKVSGTKNGDRVRYYYVDENSTFKNTIFDITEDGTYVLPKCNKLQITESTPNTNIFIGFVIILNDNPSTGVTIEVIPSNENAICLDGVDDYGKVTGLPILKDYTVAADYIRTFAKENAQDFPILSKSKVAGSGAFLFNYLNADSVTSSYSFGTNNILKEINDFERKIYYLSKYASDGHNVNAGSAVDYDTMWLGTYRDNISNFFTGALYFAMLFPYSLSEFLLERQIKKARAGTLYPNQVEFRPVIPEDENITRIDYFVVDSGIWKVIKPGDYVDVGTRIVLNVYTKLPYKVEKVSSPAFTGMNVRHSTELNIFDVEGYIKDKTPQKIKLTLAVNEDIVQWNPTITSNLLDSFTASSWYLNGWDNTLTVGTWIKKTDRVFFKATFKTELYGLETATFGGTECVVSKADNWSDSKNIWDIRMLGTVGDLSQVFNLDVYELIRFEDIVQPYPVLLRFKDENGNEVSWGGKFRVGSTITRIGSAVDSNLLPNIYNIFGLLLNGNQVTSSKVIVEKTMVFKAKSAYIFDNNEPKCILSPSRLRIPNSSYKLLGYIPDISGHGNHGVIHNSAYAERSGVNEDGSYQFDGVDDFVTIPTLSSGGKQVLMKTNWLKSPTLLYDQRASGSFAILTTKEDDATNPRIAYQARNQDGKTYIDGIENNYIETYSLKGITHNITVTNPSAGSGVVPVIGANTGKSSSFAKMALYDFMLFDEVSTDEEIKQLNDIVGIEGGYVQKPPYYWDAYGKTNSDDDRSTIQQRGVAVGDYDLTNTNFAYDKMSGFGGYTLGKFTNSWSLSNNSNSISIVARNPYDITLKKLGGNSDWEFNTTELKLTSNPVSVKFKSDKNIRFTCDYHYYTVGGNSEGAPLGITSKDLIANEDTIITISPISQENIDKYNIDINRGYYLIYFQLSPTLAVNEEVTIEMLPLYPNGLVYDGVDDYSENTSIPAFTDYTYIIKYEDFNNPNTGSCIQRKGSIKAGGGAFVQDHIYRGTKYQYNFGISSNIHKDDSIAFCTKTNYNGTAIPSGNNTDDTGFTIGKFDGYRKMVFYKEMLYPRTVNMLTINMIKNMMAEDGIIDIQGKLFTDKYTGDFYEMDFNNDFLIGN